MAKAKKSAAKPSDNPDNILKFGDTFYLQHNSGQYIVAIDRGKYNYPQLSNTGKVALQLVGGREGEAVNSSSRIKIKTTESVAAENNILGAFANSHNCYYWKDGYDEDKQSWVITKFSGESGAIRYDDQIYLTNCSYTDQRLIADTSTPGYITTAENVGDWWVIESTIALAPDQESDAPTVTSEPPSQPATASPNVAPSPAGLTQPSSATPSQRGEAESGLEFDGKTTDVEIPHHSRLDLLNDFTVEAWVKPKRFSPIQRILSKAVAYGFGLTGDQIRFTTYGKQDYDTTQAKLTVNTWVHLAVYVDAGNQAHFYVNGTLVETVAGTQAASQSSAACMIGSQGSGSENFSGQIAEVRIWQGSRQAEIEANRSYRLQGDEPGLVGYWLLNEGEGTTVHDKTSAANQGTIQGTVNWVTSDLAIAPVASSQPIPIEQSAVPSQPATAPPNVAPVPPAPTQPAVAASSSATPAIAPPIPPVKLQGQQKVLVLSANQPAISVGSGALKPQGNFTIEAWIHPATDAGKQVILADGETLFYLEGGELKFQTPSSQAIASSGAGINAGSWYHVAVTRAGSLPGMAKLYINGVQNDNQAAISPVLALGNTYLGGQPDVAETRFQGKLLEVRVWRFARSQAEIQSDLFYRLTGRELGLMRCWSLNEEFGNLVNDRTTYRAGGTIAGETTWEDAEIPLKLKLDPQERLTRSTGLEDYGYWYREIVKQQKAKTEADPPFQRGRIWA